MHLFEKWELWIISTYQNKTMLITMRFRLLYYSRELQHNIWNHFDILASGKTDIIAELIQNCSVRINLELFSQELKPCLNVNVSSEISCYFWWRLERLNYYLQIFFLNVGFKPQIFKIKIVFQIYVYETVNLKKLCWIG